MKLTTLLAASAVLALTACSKPNDYTPTAGATGQEIFKAACESCHASKGTHVYEMAADKATPEAISKKISQGGMTMPSFPNIKGAELDALVAYVQSQNKAK